MNPKCPWCGREGGNSAVKGIPTELEHDLCGYCRALYDAIILRLLSEVEISKVSCIKLMDEVSNAVNGVVKRVKST